MLIIVNVKFENYELIFKVIFKIYKIRYRKSNRVKYNNINSFI